MDFFFNLHFFKNFRRNVLWTFLKPYIVSHSLVVIRQNFVPDFTQRFFQQSLYKMLKSMLKYNYIKWILKIRKIIIIFIWMSYMSLLAKPSRNLPQLLKVSCGFYPETFEEGVSQSQEPIHSRTFKEKNPLKFSENLYRKPCTILWR